MGITLEDLEFKLFGHGFGAWYWVPNSKTVHPKRRIRWDREPGEHPFVLVTDHDGVSAVSVRARSRSNRSGPFHDAHPAQHSVSCRIREDGWIVRKPWSLHPDALSQYYFSCVEPDDRKDRLREMCAP